jgi:hypothetical protein
MHGGRGRRDVRRGHEKWHDTGRVGAGLHHLRLARGIEPEPAGWVAAARKGAAPGGRDEPPGATARPRLVAVGVGGGGCGVWGSRRLPCCGRGNPKPNPLIPCRRVNYCIDRRWGTYI